MSMHKKPLTTLEEAGLIAHGLGPDIGRPSMAADLFRIGLAWGRMATPEIIEGISKQITCGLPLDEKLRDRFQQLLEVLKNEGLNLQPGETYAGIVLGQNGEGDHHLILRPAKTEPLTWDKAVNWAKSVGGTLPTRQEQAILYGNLKHEFEPHWSCEQHAGDSDFAWMQYFSNGSQGNLLKSYEGRVRAVRRVPIDAIAASIRKS